MATRAEQTARHLGLDRELPRPLGLRALEEADRDAVWELRRESYRPVVDVQFGGWVDADQWPRFIERWSPERGLWVTREGEPLGHLVLEDRGEGLWLAEIQLLAGQRGRGHGSAVVRAIQRCAARSVRPLRLQTLRENARALDLYLRLGFVEEGRAENHVHLAWRAV
jgi:ribosomal protein S18 acetylase RimI-like enzyme